MREISIADEIAPHNFFRRISPSGREDRRVVYIQITKKGSDLLQKMDEPVTQLDKRLTGHLPLEEVVVHNSFA